MENECQFSPDRVYRYSLRHVWDEISPRRRIMWVGLNPSVADENQLDPTLRRIRAFSQAWGYTEFVMTNLFAFRATDTRDMKAAADPIGERNDAMLAAAALSSSCVVACWGVHGNHLERDWAVVKLLGGNLACLGRTKDGAPRHPLYVHSNTRLQLFG